jgi:hypothetical protein
VGGPRPYSPVFSYKHHHLGSSSDLSGGLARLQPGGSRHMGRSRSATGPSRDDEV